MNLGFVHGTCTARQQLTSSGPGPWHSPRRHDAGMILARPDAPRWTGRLVWAEITAMASEMLAWMATLALTGTARRWEPKRLRLCLFFPAGRLARGGRRLRLRLAARWPWNQIITAAIARLWQLAPG